MARKRQRSASPEPQVDEHEIPRPAEDPAAPRVVHAGDEGFHSHLQFAQDLDRTDRGILLARAEAFGFAPLRPFTLDILREISLYGQAERLCSRHWRALFEIRDAVSEVLTIEFLSTFHMRTPTPDYRDESALTFRLGGEERRLSLRQFAVHMGLYEYADLDSPDFIEGLIDFPEGVTHADVWAELGRGPYLTRIPKSTEFRDPLHRIIHRAISSGIAARGGSAAGTVTQTDLFYIFCMVHGRPCQIAEHLARYLFQVRHQKHTQQIFGGGYISRLARSLGVEAPIHQGRPQFISTPVAIDMKVLLNMRVVQRVGRTIAVVTAAQPAAPQSEPRTHDHESGGSGSGGDQVHADTSVPDSTTPVPPPPAQSAPQQAPIAHIERGPPLPIRQTYERDHFRRLQRMERMIALESAQAEARHSYMVRSLQAIASAIPGCVLPEQPAVHPDLAEFISQHTPAPDPESDPAHPPPPTADP